MVMELGTVGECVYHWNKLFKPGSGPLVVLMVRSSYLVSKRF